jgi:hypothetical protein
MYSHPSQVRDDFVILAGLLDYHELFTPFLI